MPLNTTNKAAHHQQYKSCFMYSNSAGKKITIKWHQVSLIVMSAAHTDKSFWFFVNIKTNSKENMNHSLREISL